MNILDEPTSALDPKSEYESYNIFNDLVYGKTAIYISHRLASTRFCDLIFVFDKGQIVESGSHDDLMIQKNRYFELYEMQAKYYKK